VSVGDVVEVTVLGVDVAQRRISLSMVENARRHQEEQVTAERAEQDAALSRTNERKSLGTLADLLAASKRERQ
jgi:transcriptional accessory protein Tex/SPT6